MELCSHSLQNVLQHKPQVFGRQPEEPMNSIEFYISCHIFKEILECVQYLHELNPPVIHRDLKPDNILVALNVTNRRYFKLGDFGLATVHDRNIHSMTNNKHTGDVGDIIYQAPEVAYNAKYDHRVDIYSLSKIGEEIFGLNFNDKLTNNTNNEVLGKRVLKLQDLLQSMSYYNWDHPHKPGPHWTDRPECSQVLSEYNLCDNKVSYALDGGRELGAHGPTGPSNLSYFDDRIKYGTYDEYNR
ncbi:unnamed protein product [Oppiella nova]|uniref:Protein kinase domain-containing protein n=1 Tax=Oppiella nova TaxID=334625 RepID=A0A7R9M1K9_9ACAR|nr:unnamed protein product [Oppiella nova]CAG2169077.1 unnamed protein product [Oppiella nova]